MRQHLTRAALLASSAVEAFPAACSKPSTLQVPKTAFNASIPHTNSFGSFSFDPAFWVDFFGNASDPNPLTFALFDRIVEHGGQPIVRPGGITMDSMVPRPQS